MNCENESKPEIKARVAERESKNDRETLTMNSKNDSKAHEGTRTGKEFDSRAREEERAWRTRERDMRESEKTWERRGRTSLWKKEQSKRRGRSRRARWCSSTLLGNQRESSWWSCPLVSSSSVSSTCLHVETITLFFSREMTDWSLTQNRSLNELIEAKTEQRKSNYEIKKLLYPDLTSPTCPWAKTFDDFGGHIWWLWRTHLKWYSGDICRILALSFEWSIAFNAFSHIHIHLIHVSVFRQFPLSLSRFHADTERVWKCVAVAQTAKEIVTSAVSKS